MKLVINFAPVKMVGDTVMDVGYRPYEDGLIDRLRRDYCGTHIFRSDKRTNTIVDIPVVRGARPLSSKMMEIDLLDEKRFWAPLLSEALIRQFHGQREIFSGYPVCVLGSVDGNFVQSAELPSWIQKRSILEFSPRTIFDRDDLPLFGIACDVRTKNLLRGSCQDLLKLGVPLEGRYVCVEIEQRDHRVLSRLMLVGRVKEVRGEELLLEDYRDGYEKVQASEARLSGNYLDFEWCIRNLLGDKGDRILTGADRSASELHGGPGRLDMLNKTLEYLRSRSLEAVPGVRFEVSELISQRDRGFPVMEVIEKPSLVFDPSGSRSDKWNERGIRSYGPYDQRTFSPKKLNILVICQSRHEGQVDTFTTKFLEGMPDVLTGKKGSEKARYGDGFLSRFRLERPKVNTFLANSPSVSGYIAACEDALRYSADNGFGWDLAFVQLDESFKKLDPSISPYHATKALLIKNHVAVQGVRFETITQAPKNLVFSMNQMSLASYAKLGGRPWLLNADQTIGHELVVGIGSHVASDSRVGSGKRYVGITTVFSSDGSYHLSERTNVVPFEDYLDVLTKSLKRTIDRIRDEDNWRSSDSVRLIFHMFKPAKDVEAEAIKNAVESLNLKSVTYAFLHISTQHPFVIFDYDQPGEPRWSATKKGILGPSRGVHIKVREDQSLVVFSGVSELKRASDGLPRPCLLKLHRDSTFRDMTYLARQAFDFTAHTWRIMSPEKLPITIKYSDLIAEKLTSLQKSSCWDDDAIKFREVGKTPWFL